MSNAHVIKTSEMLPRDRWWMDTLGPLKRAAIRYDPPDSPLTPSYKSVQDAVKNARRNPMASTEPRFTKPKNGLSGAPHIGPGNYEIDNTSISRAVKTNTVNNAASTVITSSVPKFRKEDTSVDVPAAKWSVEKEAKTWTSKNLYTSTMKNKGEARMYNPTSLRKDAQEARYNTDAGSNKSLAKTVADSPICYSSAFKSTTERFVPLAGYQHKNHAASAKEPYNHPSDMGPGKYHVRQTGGKNSTALGVVSGVARESSVFVSKSPRFVKPPKDGAHGAGYANSHARARGLLVLEDEETQNNHRVEQYNRELESEMRTQEGVMSATSKAQWHEGPGRFTSQAPRFRAKTFPEPLHSGAVHSSHAKHTYISEGYDLDYGVDRMDNLANKVKKSGTHCATMRSGTQRITRAAVRFNSSACPTLRDPTGPHLGPGCYAKHRGASTSSTRRGKMSGRGGILSGDAADGTVAKAAEGLRGPMAQLDKLANVGAHLAGSTHAIGKGRLHPKFNGSYIGTKGGGVTQAVPGKVKGYSSMHSNIPRFQLTTGRQVCEVPQMLAEPQNYSCKPVPPEQRYGISDIELGLGSISARGASKPPANCGRLTVR